MSQVALQSVERPTRQIANARIIDVPLPADGALALAADNAGQIEHDCNLAVACKTWGGHESYVRNAREQLAILARRLGYDLVPARGGDHG